LRIASGSILADETESRRLFTSVATPILHTPAGFYVDLTACQSAPYFHISRKFEFSSLLFFVERVSETLLAELDGWEGEWSELALVTEMACSAASETVRLKLGHEATWTRNVFAKNLAINISFYVSNYFLL
jgi:hypothetical protein